MLCTPFNLVGGNDTEDYCDPKLCETCKVDGRIPRHVACLAPGQGRFSPDCGSDVQEVVMTDELQTLLVDLHNQVRSRCAAGELPGYSTCDRMIENVSATICSKLVLICAIICNNLCNVRRPVLNLHLSMVLNETIMSD